MPLPLSGETHILDGVQIGCKAEHVLLGTVHRKREQRRGVDRHRGEGGAHDVADHGHSGPVRAEDVVAILLVRNDGRFRHVDVHVLQEPGSVAQVEHHGRVAVLGHAVRLNVYTSDDLVLSDQRLGEDCHVDVAESGRYNRDVNHLLTTKI